MESLLLKLQIFFLILFGFLVIRRISSSEQFELYLHYYAGMIFFFAGFFIGLYEKGLGLIFLVSHGLSGLGLILEKNVYDAIKSPIMADNPTNIIIYLIIATIILIISLILVVTHNLNDSFRKKDYIINKIFFLISIPIIIIMILPFV